MPLSGPVGLGLACQMHLVSRKWIDDDVGLLLLDGWHIAATISFSWILYDSESGSLGRSCSFGCLLMIYGSLRVA